MWVKMSQQPLTMEDESDKYSIIDCDCVTGEDWRIFDDLESDDAAFNKNNSSSKNINRNNNSKTTNNNYNSNSGSSEDNNIAINNNNESIHEMPTGQDFESKSTPFAQKTPVKSLPSSGVKEIDMQHSNIQGTEDGYKDEEESPSPNTFALANQEVSKLPIVVDECAYHTAIAIETSEAKECNYCKNQTKTKDSKFKDEKDNENSNGNSSTSSEPTSLYTIRDNAKGEKCSNLNDGSDNNENISNITKCTNDAYNTELDEDAVVDASNKSFVPSRVDIPNKFDVLCGQSRTLGNHTGNRRFKVILGIYAHSYSKANASKLEKMTITREVVACVASCGGKFLKYVGQEGLWEEIPHLIARDKVSNALRRQIKEMEKKRTGGVKEKGQEIEEQALPSLFKRSSSEPSSSKKRKVERRNRSSARRHSCSSDTAGALFDCQDPETLLVMKNLYRKQQEIFASLLESDKTT